MSRRAVREYVTRQRYRYREAGRAGKSRLLDEMVAVTGYHRKALIRLLRGRRHKGPARGGAPVMRVRSESNSHHRPLGLVVRPPRPRRPGRPTVYGPDVAVALRVVHEAAGGIGAKRLKPFVPELLSRLERFGELELPEHTRSLLLSASPATFERLLTPYRVPGGNRARSLTRPGSMLKHRIPIRTFGEWEDTKPGFVEIDTVAHCGHSTEGFFLWTVTAVDIATGWVEMDAVWGRTQERVQAAIKRIERRLPVKLLGLDSDNGSEFINRSLVEYCEEQQITFTRSRAGRKNDGAHVEQKNGAVIRRLAGYGRYSSHAAFRQLKEVYSLARLHANFFQPVRKLVSKSREGAKATRVYDQALTPYQRMVQSGALKGARHQVLESLYQSLNPLQLGRQIEHETDRLFALAARTVNEHASAARQGNHLFEAEDPVR